MFPPLFTPDVHESRSPMGWYVIGMPGRDYDPDPFSVHSLGASTAQEEQIRTNACGVSGKVLDGLN